MSPQALTLTRRDKLHLLHLILSIQDRRASRFICRTCPSVYCDCLNTLYTQDWREMCITLRPPPSTSPHLPTSPSSPPPPLTPILLHDWFENHRRELQDLGDEEEARIAKEKSDEKREQRRGKGRCVEKGLQRYGGSRLRNEVKREDVFLSPEGGEKAVRVWGRMGMGLGGEKGLRLRVLESRAVGSYYLF